MNCRTYHTILTNASQSARWILTTNIQLEQDQQWFSFNCDNTITIYPDPHQKKVRETTKSFSNLLSLPIEFKQNNKTKINHHHSCHLLIVYIWMIILNSHRCNVCWSYSKQKSNCWQRASNCLLINISPIWK